jgi:flagellar motor switch/type III secretory pathway protein FliN
MVGHAPVQMHPKDTQIRPFEIGALDQNQLHGAIFALTQIATPFCRELRRAMPFLARQRARLVLGDAVLASDGTLPLPTEGPSFLVTLESTGDLWAAVAFDGAAILALVEGLFGGASGEPDEVADADAAETPDSRQALGETLTLAQRAMLRRLCADLSKRLVHLVELQTHQKLSVTELVSLKRGEFPELAADALAIDCRVEGVPHPWAVRIFMGADALQKLTAQDNATKNEVDAGPTMAMAAVRIPVTVVAELGRVTLRLSQVLGLRVGDTLRLPSAANDPVLVRVEGVPKFDAVPVISRGQVAVKIQTRHSE